MDSNGGLRGRVLVVLGGLGIAVLVAAVTKLIAALIDWEGIEPGDAATWVGSIGSMVAAIATVGALVWAVRTTVNESRENRRLAREVEKDKRAADSERERAQAQSVYAWLGSHPTSDEYNVNPMECDVMVGNSSDEPVYELVAYLVWVQGAAYRTGEQAEGYGRSQSDYPIRRIRQVLQSLPPGRFVLRFEGPDNSPQQGQLGVEIAFTDRAGRHWVRRATGDLLGLPQSPMSHYEVDRPIQYSVLSAA